MNELNENDLEYTLHMFRDMTDKINKYVEELIKNKSAFNILFNTIKNGDKSCLSMYLLSINNRKELSKLSESINSLCEGVKHSTYSGNGIDAKIKNIFINKMFSPRFVYDSYMNLERAIFTVPDDEEKNRLIVLHKHLKPHYMSIDNIYNTIFNINKKQVKIILSKRRLGYVDFDDVLQEGGIGLMKAIDKFDYKKGVTFWTYAQYWIRKRISVYLKSKNIPANLVSIDKILREDNEDNLPFETMLYDKTTVDPLHIIYLGELRDEMYRTLNLLNPREREILILRFGYGGGGLTFEKIGELYGLTRARIQQIEEDSLKQLAILYKYRGLKNFL